MHNQSLKSTIGFPLVKPKKWTSACKGTAGKLVALGPFYLMESQSEPERLWTIRNRERIQRQLLDTELLGYSAPPHVVDAGSGIGEVAEVMGDLLKDRYELPQVTLLDFSKERHAEARRRLCIETKVRYRYVECDLEHIPMEDSCVDYVMCRFVFEYLADPTKVFRELVRILKPGGKLVIGDLDNNCLTHYPLDPYLEYGLQRVMEALETNHFFDPHVGRKLYSYFHDAGMTAIHVDLSAHHLFYGDLPLKDEFNWSAKIDQVMEWQRRGLVHLDMDLPQFKRRFLDFLRSPGRFSYTPFILVEGRKPA